MLHVTEPLAGVHVVRLPLPFELNHVHVAMVRDGAGYLLIDTGMSTAESFSALESGLQSIGAEWRDIRRILVTHMHPDHIGQLGRIRALTGAEVLMHRAEIAHLNALCDSGGSPWIDQGMRLAGTPHAVTAAIHHTLAHLRDALERVDGCTSLVGGERLSTALGPAEMVWTPGHTVGHICLYWPQARALYSGDHMIEKITPNIGWLPGRDCLADYIASLEKIRAYAIDCVLPSHGEPFTGHQAWIDSTVAHHHERCAVLERALGRAPATAHHLVPALWDRHLSPFHYHFALFEVMAHLEYLRGCGRVAAKENGEGALEWSAEGTPAA